jgi:hypothetical protein
MKNKMVLNKICSFVVFHEKRVFHLTGSFLNSKEYFLHSIKVNKRFHGSNLKFYSEAFDSSTRADAFLKIMEQPLLSKGINIERWVISIERHVNPLNGFLCFKVFGRLFLSKPLTTSLPDFFSSEDYTVEYSSVNTKILFEETLWSLASTQKHYNSLDSGAVFACNRRLPVFVKVQLLWQRSINLFIIGEFKRAGIQVKESQYQSVQIRFIRLMFSCLSTEAGHNLNKWLSQKNPLHTHKGSNDSENQVLIYLLYVEYNEELTFLRNIINELKNFLKEFD